MLADVEIDEDFDCLPRGAGRSCHRRDYRGIIRDGGELRRRESLLQFQKTRDRRTDERHGEKHFARASRGRHFGFGDRRGFELGDAELQLPLDQLRQLVRLHMRPQALRAAGDRDHAAQVLVHRSQVQQQRRRRNFGFVLQWGPGFKQRSSHEIFDRLSELFNLAHKRGTSKTVETRQEPCPPKLRAWFFHLERCRVDLKNRFDFHGDVPRQRPHCLRRRSASRCRTRARRPRQRARSRR